MIKLVRSKESAGVNYHDHEHIRESLYSEAKKGADASTPHIGGKIDTIDALEVNCAEGARHGIETCSVNDDIKLVVDILGLDTHLSDFSDRVCGEIDQFYIWLIESFVVSALKRNSPGAKTVVLWDELLGDNGVVYPCSNLLRNKFREQAISLPVCGDVSEVGKPFRKSGLRIKHLPVCLAFLWRQVESAPLVSTMDEASTALGACLENLGIARADFGHFFLIDFGVAERCGPIRCSLEYGQRTHDGFDLLNGLSSCRARTDDTNALAFDGFHTGHRPPRSVEALTLEVMHTWNGRKRRLIQDAHAGNEPSACIRLSKLISRRPGVVCSIEVCRLHFCVELHVLVQMEFLRDELCVF